MKIFLIFVIFSFNYLLVYSDIDIQNKITDDLISSKKIQMEIMGEKESFDQRIHLEINSPIKKDGTKINVKTHKKNNSADNSILNPIIDLEQKNYFNIRKISWEYNKMIENLRFCNIPRVLIVEVKFI